MSSKTKNASSLQCAKAVMETIPPVVRFIYACMRHEKTKLLSIPQLRALAFLETTPDASLSEIAVYLWVANPTASLLVERLVKKGFVQRKVHATERRRHCLSLTAKGKSALTQARSCGRDEVAKVLSNLDSKELEKIQVGLKALSPIFHKAVRAKRG